MSLSQPNTTHFPTTDDPPVCLTPRQSLFFKYNAKLDVFTVVEKDLFKCDLSANSQFRSAVPAPDPHTLAIVAGPEYFVGKTIEYLRSLGYAEDTIVSC
jgi:hypothetical protein